MIRIQFKRKVTRPSRLESLIGLRKERGRKFKLFSLEFVSSDDGNQLLTLIQSQRENMFLDKEEKRKKQKEKEIEGEKKVENSNEFLPKQELHCAVLN